MLRGPSVPVGSGCGCGCGPSRCLISSIRGGTKSNVSHERALGSARLGSRQGLLTRALLLLLLNRPPESSSSSCSAVLHATPASIPDYSASRLVACAALLNQSMRVSYFENETRASVSVDGTRCDGDSTRRVRPPRGKAILKYIRDTLNLSSSIANAHSHSDSASAAAAAAVDAPATREFSIRRGAGS